MALCPPTVSRDMTFLDVHGVVKDVHPTGFDGVEAFFSRNRQRLCVHIVSPGAIAEAGEPTHSVDDGVGS